MKRKSLNNSLHRIETDVETPLDLSKPQKRIVKLFYKKGKLLQGHSHDLKNGEIKVGASGPAKVLRMRTVKLSEQFSAPNFSRSQNTSKDRQHSKRHHETDSTTVQPKPTFGGNM